MPSVEDEPTATIVMGWADKPAPLSKASVRADWQICSSSGSETAGAVRLKPKAKASQGKAKDLPCSFERATVSEFTVLAPALPRVFADFIFAKLNTQP